MIKPHDNTIQDMGREIAELRANLADATAWAERAEADANIRVGLMASTIDRFQVRAEKAEAERDAFKAAEAECHAKLVASDDALITALAACAEMRAALLDWHGPPNPEHSVEHCPTCALLSRPDLGAGKVLVPREMVERWRYAIDALLHHRAHRSSCARCDPVRTVVVDLDALLKRGGG